MWDVILAALFTALIIIMGIGTQEDYVLYGTAIVAAIICVMLLLYTKRIIPKNILVLVLAIVVIGESGVTAYIGVKTTTVTGTYDYPRGEEKTAAIIDQMNELEQDTTELWRAEMTSTQTLNDGALNGYNGLSMFNSMANESITIFFENFGMMGWQSGNRYTYAESSPVTNMFMNLKYLISRNGSYQNTYDLESVYEVENEKLLLNQHYIPMGFMVNNALMNWKVNDSEDNFNQFDQQNEFFKLATGIKEDVYTPLQVVSQGHTSYDQFQVNKTEYGCYQFNCLDSSITPTVKWNYEAPDDGLYCMYADIDGGDDVTIMRNDAAQPNTYGMGRPYVACIGKFDKGDKISVYSQLEQGQSGNARVYVCKFNEDVFEQGYEAVSRDVMTTTKCTGSSMEGTINVSESGLFYTSVPYEEGWTATVDGREVEITPVGDALIAFKLSEGEHTIKLTYYPKGFWPGVAVSSVCLAAFVFACLYVYVFRKRKTKK